jgi:hypothetical protein
MNIRARKLIGTMVLIVLTLFWPLLTLGLLHSRLSAFYAPAQVAFLIVLGLIWLVPAALLIRWMQRPDPQ